MQRSLPRPRQISTDWLALWLEFLTPDQDDMSSSSFAGQNLVRYLKVEDLWGQAFYKPFLISPPDGIDKIRSDPTL
jgi:hypothetical protein